MVGYGPAIAEHVVLAAGLDPNTILTAAPGDEGKGGEAQVG